MIVYDLDGAEHNKEPVDVKECVDILGWTIEKPEPKKAKKPKEENKEAEEKPAE